MNVIRQLPRAVKSRTSVPKIGLVAPVQRWYADEKVDECNIKENSSCNPKDIDYFRSMLISGKDSAIKFTTLDLKQFIDLSSLNSEDILLLNSAFHRNPKAHYDRTYNIYKLATEYVTLLINNGCIEDVIQVISYSPLKWRSYFYESKIFEIVFEHLYDCKRYSDVINIFNSIVDHNHVPLTIPIQNICIKCFYNLNRREDVFGAVRLVNISHALDIVSEEVLYFSVALALRNQMFDYGRRLLTFKRKTKLETNSLLNLSLLCWCKINSKVALEILKKLVNLPQMKEQIIIVEKDFLVLSDVVDSIHDSIVKNEKIEDKTQILEEFTECKTYLLQHSRIKNMTIEEMMANMDNGVFL